MKQINFKISQFRKLALVACTLSALAGCGSQLTDDRNRSDARLQHPIQVAREQVSITIDLPTQGNALSPSDERRLKGFIRDFVNRGRTAIVVESQMGEHAREIMEASGLKTNEIIISPDATTKAPAAILTFTANVVRPPDCGNWDENYAFDPTNNMQPDFGCSSRHNMGLTVADPGDLIDAQPMSGHGAARRDTVLDSYSSGDTIGPAPTTTDTSKVSGVK
jgi:pilus biogenesis lipoprotein CpaD